MTRMPAIFIGHGSPMNTLELFRIRDAKPGKRLTFDTPSVLSMKLHSDRRQVQSDSERSMKLAALVHPA